MKSQNTHVSQGKIYETSIRAAMLLAQSIEKLGNMFDTEKPSLVVAIGEIDTDWCQYEKR